MNSQLASLLKKYIENTVNGLRHENEKLIQILSYFASKQQSQGVVILKMIALLIEYSFSQEMDELKKNQTLIKIFAKLLQYLAPLVTVSPPLSYLVNRKFQNFISECQKQFNDKNMKDLLVNSQGLYPSNDRNGKGSIFSFHSQKKEPCEGNPNWLYARYLLYTFYNLHKDEMSEKIKEIYLFLLNSENLFKGSNFINKLWAKIYRFYTQTILDSNVEDLSLLDSSLITWNRVDFQTFRKSISDSQFTLPDQSKLLYFILLDILNIPFCQIQEQQIKQIYSLFTDFAYQDINLQLIGNILFLRLTRMRNQVQLQQQVSRYGQKLLENGVSEPILFFPLFYSTSQIIQKIINQNISFSELPLNEAQKRQISHCLFQRHKLKRENLNYLQIQHFLEIFSSTLWKQQEYLKHTLELIQENKLLFTYKIMTLAQQTSKNIAAKQLELFLQAWRSYQSILISDIIDQNNLQRILALRKNDLKKKYHFMIIPREMPEVVLKVMLSYYKFFNQMKKNSQSKANLQTLVNQFQDNYLQELLPLINEEHKDLFWKDWINLLSADEQFVGVLMNSKQK